MTYEIVQTYKVVCQNNRCEFMCMDHEDQGDAFVCGVTHDVQCLHNSSTEHLLAAHGFFAVLTDHGIQLSGG